MSILLAVAGFVLTWWVVRRVSDDDVCLKLALAAYGLKIAVTILLYCISLFRWPILSWYQGEPGFWVFAEDAVGYHFDGRALAEFWRGAGPSPHVDVSNWSFLVYTALLYFLLGPHPLNLSLLNAWYGTAVIVAALVILKRIGSPRSSARLAVGLLGFWPSLVLWSSQPMKDPLVLALTLLLLACVVGLITEQWQGQAPANPAVHRAGWRGSIGWAGLAGGLLFVVSCFRFYTGLVFALILLAACGFLVLRALTKRAFVRAGQCLAIVAIVLVAWPTSSQIDLTKLAAEPAAAQPQTADPPATQADSAAKPDAQGPPPHAIPADPTLEELVRAADRWGSRVLQQDAGTPPPLAVEADLFSRLPALSRSEIIAVLKHELGVASARAAPRRKAHGLLLMLTEKLQPLAMVLPQVSLSGLRGGFVITGGYSLLDPTVSFRTPFDVLWYAPRGFTVGLLAPFPTQWFEVSGRTRVFRIFAAVEALLLYFLLAGFLLRMRALRPYLGLPTVVLCLFVVLMAIPMCLTVANFGTLFRLRLQFLIPLLLVLCLVDVPGVSRDGVQSPRGSA